MRYDPTVHHRRSIRLSAYDYASSGAYSVTICTHARECIFNDPDLKATAEDVWRTVAGTPGPLDVFVVMPNHVHGIIWITPANVVGARQRYGSNAEGRPTTQWGRARGTSSLPRPYAQPAGIRPLPRPYAPPSRPRSLPRPYAPPSGSLGSIVGSFKSAVAKRINNLRGTPGAPVWQRNYYEHVIRSEEELCRIRDYILDNPRRWHEDPENPANAAPALRPDSLWP